MIQLIEHRINNSGTIAKDVTFVNAKSEAIHRWYPYLEGFSENFIKDIINNLKSKPTKIYEPFSGSGTLPVYAFQNEIDIFYSEINPFLQDLASFKLKILSLTEENKYKLVAELESLSKHLLSNIEKAKIDEELHELYKKVFGESIYFEKKNYHAILKTKTFLKNFNSSQLARML